MPEIRLPTIRLHYEEHGAGTPILLIHGTGGDAGTWGRRLTNWPRRVSIFAIVPIDRLELAHSSNECQEREAKKQNREY